MKLSSPLLGLVGLLAIGVVALGLLHGRLTIAQAGGRAGVALVVLLVVDRLVLPVARTLVGEPAGRSQED